MSCRVSFMVVSHYYQRGEQARPQPFLRVSCPSRTTHPHSSEPATPWTYLVPQNSGDDDGVLDLEMADHTEEPSW